MIFLSYNAGYLIEHLHSIKYVKLTSHYSYFRTNFSVRQLLVCTRFSYFFVYIIDSDRHPRNICKTAEMLGFSAAQHLCRKPERFFHRADPVLHPAAIKTQFTNLYAALYTAADIDQSHRLLGRAPSRACNPGRA